MKALTICQPYAEMIACGEKTIENRTWPTSYRGPLAIHAGKSRAWLEAEDERERPGMAFGAIVATARVVDCIHVDRLSEAHAANHHANGPWCWILEARGAQGLWDWSAEASR